MNTVIGPKAFNIKSPAITNNKKSASIGKKPNKKLRILLIMLLLAAIIVSAIFIYQQRTSYEGKAIVVCGQTLPYPVCVVQGPLPANCCKKKSPVCYECRHGSGGIVMVGCCGQTTPTAVPPPPQRPTSTPVPPMPTVPPLPTQPPAPTVPNPTIPIYPTSTPRPGVTIPFMTLTPTPRPRISIPFMSPTPIPPSNTPIPTQRPGEPTYTPYPTTAPSATPIPGCFDRTCNTDADCSGLDNHICKDVGGGYLRRCVRYPDNNCSSGDKNCWCTAPTVGPTSQTVETTQAPTALPSTGIINWSFFVIIIGLTAIGLGLLL